MRLLNNREKTILKELVDFKEQKRNSLTFSLFSYLHIFLEKRDMALLIDNELNQLILYIKFELIAGKNCLIKYNEFYEAFEVFSELVLLIDYLKKSSYIRIFPHNLSSQPQALSLTIIYQEQCKFFKQDQRYTEDKLLLNFQGDYIQFQANPHIIYDQKENELYKSSVPLESELYQLLTGVLNGYIHMNESLINFIENDFKTLEDQRFDKQLATSIEQFNEQLVNSQAQFEEQLDTSRDQFNKQSGFSIFAILVSIEQFNAQLVNSQAQFEKQLDTSRDQFNKQSGFSITAILVSIISLLISTYTIYIQNQVKPTLINSQQYDKFIDIYKSEQKKLDSIKDEIKDFKKQFNKKKK